MADVADVVETIANAPSWDARVALIRRIPEAFGTSEQASVYAAVARRVYVPRLTPEFAYVHWREKYELAPLEQAYAIAAARTQGFANVASADLERVLLESPTTLKVFRLLLGLTASEFAEACAIVAEQLNLRGVSKSSVENAEESGRIRADAATTCAAVVDMAMTGALFPTKGAGAVRLKLQKPDTNLGWASVREFAERGVPLPVFLHQRLYGGAFIQLLNATSKSRGDLLEDPLQDLFIQSRIPHVRTGAHNQDAVAVRFGVTVRPAPDFIVYDKRNDTLRAILECKGDKRRWYCKR